ncbi:MAG: DUF695 domain-containing protein, partial [Campylobacterota bacterium]|nr:DUF695 domain-containing protein [Campylobacterota bacterium]
EKYRKLNDVDELIDVEVNLDLIDELEDSEKKSLLWLFVKDSGSTCSSVNSELIDSVTKNLQALYAGQKLEDGWCEFYFYAYSGKKFSTVVADVLKNYENVVFELGTSKDNRFEHYFYKLYPSELELLQMKSASIIAELIKESDNIAAEREVEHYMLFQTPASKERFKSSGKFEIKEEFEEQGDYCYGVVTLQKHSMLEDVVREKVSELYEIALQEHARYELWSTTLAQKDKTNE